MIQELIAAERRELAVVLDGLSPGDWVTPTLCAGWRVPEVVAHMTMPFRFSTGRFVRELVKSGGRFHAMADRVARRDAAELSREALVASLRDNADHLWRPPGGGAEGALSHDVIHGLDITTALGLERRVPPERLEVIFAAMKPKQVKYFGTDLDGVALRADDLDWSYGTGTPLTGAAQDLLLVLCNRRLPAGRLRGEPSARFTTV
ncbi:maleylpyruvate isomerase family mycothiol-dependent enzyme [Amycolatopsis sp. FBCC-B4732]|uniref:maleylpyruvate isomerase family mycothiol-dependent enzyme n=1 Tax=Amycolatopsis sp. FBCC-B4732 TaxID=3079339 RepID=UPI001FF1CDA0|nr:maleylpyruvate isomerase family mycothiol-dependent enzyme [Amycolatopsis sp. FBCC-B4732]UOX86684.1 maleylpyruvate isomerase family mycothiol-dependent enzyme [Amycolatopsis sp. FBCC-B4732]